MKHTETMNFVIVTGLSGAGKTQAKKVFEDIGFFCVDNLPPMLIPSFVSILEQNNEEIRNVGLFIDIRGGIFFTDLEKNIRLLKDSGYAVTLVFLEADTPVLIKRFKETRRVHPMLPYATLDVAIPQERELLSGIRKQSDIIIDTSMTTQNELSKMIRKALNINMDNHFSVTLLSFGFKRGIPVDADFVFDLRFLQNPFYVEELRHKTGLDEEVREYVLQSELARQYLEKIREMLMLLLPSMKKDGRNHVVLAFGCTGGQHRSVTFAFELDRYLQEAGVESVLQNREESYWRLVQE